MLSKLSCISIAAPAFLPPTAAAQLLPSACPAPPNALKLSQPKIFSENGLQWRGDATAGHSYRIVRDRAADAYLDRITARLLKASTLKAIHLRLASMDIPAVAFPIAGRSADISRKLLVDSKSQDEIG